MPPNLTNLLLLSIINLQQRTGANERFENTIKEWIAQWRCTNKCVSQLGRHLRRIKHLTQHNDWLVMCVCNVQYNLREREKANESANRMNTCCKRFFSCPFSIVEETINKQQYKNIDQNTKRIFFFSLHATHLVVVVVVSTPPIVWVDEWMKCQMDCKISDKNWSRESSHARPTRESPYPSTVGELLSNN